MSNVSINGTIAIFMANLLGKIFGAIYRIPLSNMLGAGGMGLYQMAFPIYSFLLTFITGGVSVTLSRKIAGLRARGDNSQIYKQYILGRNISFFAGAILTILIFILAYPLSYIQGNSMAMYGYFAIGIGFVFATLLGSYRGYFQGHGNMVPTAVSQVFEQMSKLAVGLFLAFFLGKRGVIWGVFGALLGISISEFIAYLYFLFIHKKIKKEKIDITGKDYRDFLRESMPIGINHGLSPLSSLVDSFLIVNLLVLSGYYTNFATILYGIETGMILPLINIPNVLVGALAITCVPNLSYKLSAGANLSNELNEIFKIVFLFIIPCGVGLFVLASPIVTTIYPNLDSNLALVATNLLKFSVFEMFFMCIVTISNSCLQAVDKSKTAVISLMVGLIIKLILTVILVITPQINIYGLVIASVFGYFVSAIISIKELKYACKFSFSVKNILLPIFSSMFMCAFLLLLLYLIGGVGSIYSLGSLILLSVIVYFAFGFIFGGIKVSDLKNLLQKSGN